MRVRVCNLSVKEKVCIVGEMNRKKEMGVREKDTKVCACALKCMCV